MDAYYRDASSSDSVLAIRIPFLAIQALDDPVSVRGADRSETTSDWQRSPYARRYPTMSSNRIHIRCSVPPRSVATFPGSSWEGDAGTLDQYVLPPGHPKRPGMLTTQVTNFLKAMASDIESVSPETRLSGEAVEHGRPGVTFDPMRRKLDIRPS